jgi:DNA repair exonuclease SbcCD nuclease subunit
MDDYTEAVLNKLKFCLELASSRNLLPVILGDLFHVPRSNPNHLLVDLIEMFQPVRPWVLVGNHDKYESRLTRDVSLSVLGAAGVIRLIGESGAVASVEIGECRVLLGASPDWTSIPREVERGDHEYVIWLSHHDLKFPGYESGRVHLRELPGVDLIVNGHIHTPKPPQVCGATTWCNPGSIVRITRSRTTRSIRPCVCIWSPTTVEMETVEVPHLPFEQVFPPLSEMDGPDMVQDDLPVDESLFIKGLENLALRRSTEGVGLQAFLESNLKKEDPVDKIIWELFEEVMNDE